MNRRRTPPGTPVLRASYDGACWWEWPCGARSVTYATEHDARWWKRNGLVWANDAGQIQVTGETYSEARKRGRVANG